MAGLRKCHPHVFQCSREEAEKHWPEHDCVLGVCPNKAVGPVNYLSHGVRDEDTPTQEDITTWVDFCNKNRIGYGGRVIVHCEAGQNRSAIVAALIIVTCLYRKATTEAWDEVVARLHDEFMLCDPPHNWWPYEHWDKAIRNWLTKETVHVYTP